MHVDLSRFSDNNVLVLVLMAVLVAVPSIVSVEGKGFPYLVRYEGKQYEVTYLILDYSGNAIVKDITAQDFAIKTTIQSEESADLMLVIPRALLGATHISYYAESSTERWDDGRVTGVLVDGKSTENYSAIGSESVVMFNIPFQAGTKEIEIVGSTVPEFYSVANKDAALFSNFALVSSIAVLGGVGVAAYLFIRKTKRSMRGVQKAR